MRIPWQNYRFNTLVVASTLLLGACSSNDSLALYDVGVSAKNKPEMGTMIVSDPIQLASLRQAEHFDLSFAQDSVELSSSSMQTLASSAHMAKHWLDSSAVRVEIASFSPRSDREKWTESLQFRRIDSVRHVLLAFGLPESVLVIKKPEEALNTESGSSELDKIRLTLVRVANDQLAGLLRFP